jgi:RAD54-like protein 2
MASLATDIDNLPVTNTESNNSEDHLLFVEESPTSEISDEESRSTILSEEEQDGYQGDTDNQNIPVSQNSTSDTGSEKEDDSKRIKKSFANKKTRIMSEAKRSIRMKRSAKTISKAGPTICNANMPIESSKVIATDGMPLAGYETLHSRDAGQINSDNFALDISSTSTSSCEEHPEIANPEGKTSSNHSEIDTKCPKNIQSTQKDRKRKREKCDDKNKAKESKSKKKHKSSHLRKNIKDIFKEDSLQTEAKTAKEEEQERLKRLHESQASQKKLFQEVLAKQNYVRWQQQQEQEHQQKRHQITKYQDEVVSTKNRDEIIHISSSSGEDDSTKKSISQLLETSNKLSAVLDKAGTIRLENANYAINHSTSKEKNSFCSADTKSMTCEKVKHREPLLDRSSSDDCKIVEYEDVLNESEEEDQDNSGMHVDDRLNVPQYSGEFNDEKVLVNVGHSSEEPDIYLPQQIQDIIKPHQIGGIRFLYDNLIENLKRFRSSPGFGCILAHAMGLGKTLQVISFCNIFLTYTKAKCILCIVPINTIQNWLAEFNKWLPSSENTDNCRASKIDYRNFEVYLLNDTAKNLEQRAKIIFRWKEKGGVLLMGYELFRMLATKKQRKKRKKKKDPHLCIDLEEEDIEKSNLEEIQKVLVNPGPDLVVCDEGHRIKNAHASTSQALKNIATKRRLVLTGYPLQNNLMEYWCMVDFVRPNFLGNKIEFANMFERPIQNGLCLDSTARDVRVMMHRSHVLYQELKGFVQRRSHNVLQETLPPKREHVILVRMSKIQKILYKTFMDEIVLNALVTANPLKAFAVCCKIWNHPDVLYNFMRKKEASNLLDLDIEIDELAVPSTSVTDTTLSTQNHPGKSEHHNQSTTAKYNNEGKSDQSVSQNGLIQGPGFNAPGLSTTVTGKKNGGVVGDEIDYDWVDGLFQGYTSGLLENSAKLKIFLHLLDETVKVGERMLLFSQSLLTLNVIEEFLKKRQIPECDVNWVPGVHYYRLDGSTPAMERERLINSFNAADCHVDATNLDQVREVNKSRPLLFLISTKAGSLGVNLVGACRVVIFDASWNPCHDSQAVCRVYRYGQVRSCYIYRLVTDGSLERKIYDRQINKQGMSNRIVDEMNPDAYLHSKDIHSLLCLEEDEPRGNICKQSGKSRELNPDAFKGIDNVLSKVLRDSMYETTAQPFTHESLLIDRKETSLSKAEKRMAERSYKIERGARISYKRTSYADYYPQSSTSQSAVNGASSGNYGSTPASFNHLSSMNLNLKRNSYASFYNNQEPTTSRSYPLPLLNPTNHEISQLHNGIKSPDESATLVHPVWPATQRPSCNSNGTYSNGQMNVPIQQKVPPNYIKPNVRSYGDQERGDFKNQG